MLGSPWDIRFHKGYLLFTRNGYVYGYRSEIYLNPHLRLGKRNLLISVTNFLISLWRKPDYFSRQVEASRTGKGYEHLKGVAKGKDLIEDASKKHYPCSRPLPLKFGHVRLP